MGSKKVPLTDNGGNFLADQCLPTRFERDGLFINFINSVSFSCADCFSRCRKAAGEHRSPAELFLLALTRSPQLNAGEFRRRRAAIKQQHPVAGAGTAPDMALNEAEIVYEYLESKRSIQLKAARIQ